MMSVVPKRLAMALVALGLSAAAAPTWAVTDLTFCDEITQPGAYRVTADLHCHACLQCLLIDANNVTIDLQGHTLTGDGSRASVGIKTSGAILSNIEVRNGTITAFGHGIDLGGTLGARVERMRVFKNTRSGIRTAGGSVVASNIVMRNALEGIVVTGSGGNGALVVDNLAVENGTIGIRVKSGSAVRGNVANGNGAEGITVVCPSLVSDNAAVANSTNHSPEDLAVLGVG